MGQLNKDKQTELEQAIQEAVTRLETLQVHLEYLVADYKHGYYKLATAGYTDLQELYITLDNVEALVNDLVEEN